VDLVEMNPFFKAYGNVKVEKGTFGLYTEMAGKDGMFKGYVKPVIKDIKVKTGEGSFSDKLWEAVVSGATDLLKNSKVDQVATKVPLQGRFEKPKTELWTAIAYVLRNAFIYALRPSIDQEVNIGNVKEPEEKEGFFKRLFGKKTKEDMPEKTVEKEEKSEKKKKEK
jgi:hypothetical protein